jgi:hypothetical protein
MPEHKLNARVWQRGPHWVLEVEGREMARQPVDPDDLDPIQFALRITDLNWTGEIAA